MYETNLSVEYIDIDELVMYKNNSKLHDAKQVDQIASSIEEFGFNSPILAWHNDDGEPEIVAGHGRLMAARKLGLEELPVVFLDHMDEEHRRAYTLVDNQLTMNSGFDFSILDNELTDITNIDMADFGFNLEGIMSDMKMDEFFIETVQRDESQDDQLPSDNQNQTDELNDTTQTKRTIKCPHCGEIIEL